jgi:hypothetical protein
MTSPSIDQELLSLEAEYWEAVKNRDAVTAARLSDDPCIVTGAQGVRRIRRADIAALMNSASIIVRDFAIDDAEVQRLSDDVAVVAYRVHEDLSMDGRLVTVDAVDASTWVRRNGRWLCALHSETLAGEMPARAESGDDRRATDRYHQLLSEIGGVLRAFPHLRFGSAVSPSMPDAMEDPLSTSRTASPPGPARSDDDASSPSR